MDLTDVDIDDFAAPDGPKKKKDDVQPGCYVACVDELKDGLSNAGNRMLTLEAVISEGHYKGKRLRHWFVVENKWGKADFKRFLKAISSTNEAPDKFTDEMKRHCLGKEFRIGVGLEYHGGWLNPRIICLGNLKDDESDFSKRWEKALTALEKKNDKAINPPKAEFVASGDVQF